MSEPTEKKKKKKKPVDDTNGQSSAAAVVPPSSTSNGHTTTITAPVISAPATAPTTRTRVASVATPAPVAPQASILDFDVFGTAAPAPTSQPMETQHVGGTVTAVPTNGGGDWANFESVIDLHYSSSSIEDYMLS